MAQKIITVLGATGAQGGGLVRAIQNDKSKEFIARAVTRDVNSAKARELAALGAEVISADVDNINSLQRAFEGAYGAYCVTFYWAHLSPEKELAEAGAMAKAAKDQGLKHVIWSTLEDTRKLYPLEDQRLPTLMEKYKVPHFDAKGEANDLFTGLNIPVSFLMAAFYWDNFIYFGAGPKKVAENQYALTLPMGDKKLAGIGTQDIGKCAYGIFKQGSKWIGKTAGIAGEQLTGKQIAEKMSKALGKNIQYNEVSAETYRSFGFPGADDLGNMFQFYQDYEDYFHDARSVEIARSLNPELENFDQWLQKHKNEIPLD
jgi:uncharacterized protein YbjT (DUF2867 family)